ncbi:MAG: hypothetical protein R3F54_23955 [Alphaproteobacteria bacterium]
MKAQEVTHSAIAVASDKLSVSKDEGLSSQVLGRIVADSAFARVEATSLDLTPKHIRDQARFDIGDLPEVTGECFQDALARSLAYHLAFVDRQLLMCERARMAMTTAASFLEQGVRIGSLRLDRCRRNEAKRRHQRQSEQKQPPAMQASALANRRDRHVGDVDRPADQLLPPPASSPSLSRSRS